MKCPKCGNDDDKVLDSRSARDGAAIRRRRECMKCGRRFTTYEKIELNPLFVIKRDGRREAFEIQKVKAGILHACNGLPISMQQIDDIVGRVERKAYATLDGEVSTESIGDMVMAELKELNEVAYVRFAAVYRKFTDLATFMQELQKLVDENKM